MNELGFAGGIRIGYGRIRNMVRVVESKPRFGFRGLRHGADHPGAAGQRRPLRQLGAAQQRPGPVLSLFCDTVQITP